MLQEIQVRDIKNVHACAIKEYYFLIYEEVRKRQVELKLSDNFYFDDNFYWEEIYLKVPSKVKQNMIYGKELYCGITIDFKKAKEEIFKVIKEKYSSEHSWAKSDYDIQKKINVVFNKFRPTQSFNEKIEKELLEREMQAKIEKQQPPQIVNSSSIVKKNAYIYGIKIDNELVYIGKTYRDLKERISEHIECMLDESINNSQQNYLYKAMRECEIGYKFELLYESHNAIGNYELEKIEKSLIENIKPKFNYEGVKVPYRFSEDK